MNKTIKKMMIKTNQRHRKKKKSREGRREVGAGAVHMDGGRSSFLY
jgi:hypothetical protein